MLIAEIEQITTMERDERGRFSKSPGGSNSKKITIRTKEDKYEKLKHFAQEQGITVHEAARKILEEFLEKYEITKSEEL